MTTHNSDSQNPLSQANGYRPTHRDGFNRIVWYLDAAIYLARLSGMQRSILDYARQISWGYTSPDGDARPFEINISEIAEDLKSDRKWVRKERDRLIAMRVLLDLGDSTYLINKYFDTWLDEKGEYLVSLDAVRARIDAIKASINRADYPQVGSTDPSPNRGQLTPPPPAPITSIRNTKYTPLSPPRVGACAALPEGEKTPSAKPKRRRSPPPSAKGPVYEPLTIDPEMRAHLDAIAAKRAALSQVQSQPTTGKEADSGE